MNHYNVRRGFIAEASAGTVPEWSAHAPGYLHEDYNPPCLVVTGDLDAARARLEATTPDDVKQAAVDALSTFASIKLRPISWAEAVNALADAGLLAGPSHLDRLAAWADEHNISVDIVRAAFTTSSGTLTPWAASAEGAGTEFDEDVQEAARRVLARLEGRES